MKLYHGSNIRIDAIDLSASKPNKDFGSAFYLSPDLEQAKEMAAFKAELLGGIEVVTEFEIGSFDGLSVKSFDSYQTRLHHIR